MSKTILIRLELSVSVRPVSVPKISAPTTRLAFGIVSTMVFFNTVQGILNVQKVVGQKQPTEVCVQFMNTRNVCDEQQ